MKKSIRTFLKHPTKDNSNRSANPAVIRASTILFNTMPGSGLDGLTQILAGFPE